MFRYEWFVLVVAQKILVKVILVVRYLVHFTMNSAANGFYKDWLVSVNQRVGKLSFEKSSKGLFWLASKTPPVARLFGNMFLNKIIFIILLFYNKLNFRWWVILKWWPMTDLISLICTWYLDILQAAAWVPFQLKTKSTWFFTILHNVKMFRKLLRLKSEVIGNIHPSMSHTCLKFHTYMT